MLTLSTKRLLIDSSSMHVATALNLPSVVGWIGTNPKVFGYEMHDNIKANDYTRKPELRNSFLSEINFGGEPIEFPYNNEDEIFDVEKIIASLESGEVVETPIQQIAAPIQDELDYTEISE